MAPKKISLNCKISKIFLSHWYCSLNSQPLFGSFPRPTPVSFGSGPWERAEECLDSMMTYFQKSQRDWWGASLLKYLCACWLFLKPRPHERFHWKKRIFFEAFSPSVHTETMKTEVFENGSQSSGFRKKMRFQMKTHWCGRVTSKTLEWCQSKLSHNIVPSPHRKITHAQCLSVAFSKRFCVLMWTGENDVKTLVWT